MPDSKRPPGRLPTGRARVGVVGTAFSPRPGPVAGPLVRRAELAGVVGSTQDKARDYAERFGSGRAFASFDELIESDDIDVVDLCVPNRLHRFLAVQAAEAGKHVICTKPLTAYVGQDLGRRPHRRPGVVAQGR